MVANGDSVVITLAAAIPNGIFWAERDGVEPPSIVSFPDGLEIAGGQQIGVSELALNVDLTVTVILIGYEY